MGSETYQVTVESDHLARMTRARPVSALSELIWNSLDADADNVRVLFQEGLLGELGEIVVVDDGSGIPWDDVPKLFAHLGGSWKRAGGVTKEKGRFLHGQEGRGRFKALALGRIAEWQVTYRDEAGLWSYTITLDASDVCKVKVSDRVAADEVRSTGVTVRISELERNLRSLKSYTAMGELTETFALYLTDYKGVVVEIDGDRLDPSPLIAARVSLAIDPVTQEGVSYTGSLEMIEWRAGGTRTLYLCNDRGAPLFKTNRRFQIGAGHSFSGYLKAPFFRDLQEQQTLELAEMNPIAIELINRSQDAIKDYFFERTAEEARALVEEWKLDRIYPYQGDPESTVEKAERQVFDIVAVNVAKHVPDFGAVPPAGKALHLRLLRHAIEKSPNELQLILEEVLKLPKRSQKDLAQLLQDTTLSSIIGAAKIVADRLKFLRGLESILFDSDKKARLKERSQLHRIVADNPWLFGEEFSLSVDDQSLTEVLRKHKKALGENIVISEPVKHVSKARGIVDLMLSRAIRRHSASDLTHLVVELKAPSVKVNSKEILQIEEYALSVRKDERFRNLNVSWQFWVISDDYGDYAADRIQDSTGLIRSKDNQKIFVKTWSQILADNRGRLQFFQEKLEYQADKGAALNQLHEQYEAFLQGVVIDDDLLTETDFAEENAGELLKHQSNED
jgi:hypothetical protein